jgi:hypothetical protein
VFVAFFALALAGGCEQVRKTPAPERTLPPGVKVATPTEEPPTVIPATQTPAPEVLTDSDFDVRGLEVTLPVSSRTVLRTVERCPFDACQGYALPPGTPILAPMDGRIVIGPTAEDTSCSVVVAIYRAEDANTGRLRDPAETVDLTVGCDAAVEVEPGDEVVRGDVLVRLGQRGIYEGRGDAPPTVLRFTCSFGSHGCTWAGGSPHYYEQPEPTTTPTAGPSGTATPPVSVTASPTPVP